MRCAQRIEAMEYSPIRNLYPLEQKVKEEGVTVIHANIGQPDIPTPSLFWDCLGSSLQGVSHLPYGPSQGSLPLRNAFVDFYTRRGTDITLDNVLVTTAASEALLFSLLAVADSGDEVLVFEPFYTNYRTLCATAGLKMVVIPTYWEKGFSPPSPQEILPYITKKTKALLLCNPNNPTGVVYERQELEKLLDFCKGHDLWVIADEVYRDFVYGTESLSVLDFPSGRACGIVVDSLSKRYSACGARLGALICANTELNNQVLKLAQGRLSPPTIEQDAAAHLIEHGDQEILQMKRLYEQRIAVLCESLDALGHVEYVRPRGAFYVMVRLPVDDSLEFAKFLLTSVRVDGHTLLVAPASGFYADAHRGKQEIRLAAVLDTPILLQAVEILKKGLELYRTKTAMS